MNENNCVVITALQFLNDLALEHDGTENCRKCKALASLKVLNEMSLQKPMAEQAIQAAQKSARDN
jgi:hypothetical protein